MYLYYACTLHMKLYKANLVYCLSVGCAVCYSSIVVLNTIYTKTAKL